MVLCYLQTANRLMKRIGERLPEKVRHRITCSTVDSAKGLEAHHVRIVFVPHHEKTKTNMISGGCREILVASIKRLCVRQNH